MPDQPLARLPSPEARPDAPRGLWDSTWLSTAICLVVANLATILLMRLTTHPTAMLFNWWTQVALVTLMLLTSTFLCLHQWLHWKKPAVKARELLAKVRAGEATIGELATIRGGIAPLVRDVQEILRELRGQKAEIARIEAEMAQRIANRTDALERTLGACRQQAAKDALTGLYNRRTLDELLPRMFARCREESVPLALMMIDVDDFKLLNDTLGHPAGDDFLRSLGQLIRSTLRDSDMAFRFGGDEFVILLPNHNRAQASPVGDRLVSLVDALTKSLHVARPPRLSIGLVSSLDLPSEASGESLLHQADRALYDIKLTRQIKRGEAARRKVA